MTGGVSCLVEGLGMWRRQPRLMLFGVLPALIVLLVLLAAFTALLLNVADLVSWATPFADDWGVAGLLRAGLVVAVVVAAVLLAAATFVALTLAVGEPFYARIWRETEVMLGGPVPDAGLGMWRGVRDSLGLLVLGLIAALGVLVLGLLPVIGPVAGVLIGFVVSGRLLAGELVGRAFEERGIDRQERKPVMRAHRAQLFGFGIATQAFFLIPLGAVFVMPAAVSGATVLARRMLGETGASLTAR